ncbi:MAG: Gfo/Idh/MocA family oxidoreductase [Verrucomicrobia bacterium]|nr:Gfo/Idh/MocA family oxidoreductase [Verrucomicrobiota bacterium]MDA1086135.1 Gfo/Idh/MocA family oxidoreductase [Verrucomicrobiota bacterium]
MPAPLQVGVIGCGHAAVELHLPALKTISGVTLAAVADLDANRLAGVADRFQVPRRYHDPHELIADRELSVVAVLTPPQSHHGLVVQCLEAGKHILVEKPVTLDDTEAADLVQRAASSNVKVCVGHSMRFHPHVQRAKQILTSAALGAIESIQCRWISAWRNDHDPPEWRRNPVTGGSTLLETAVHHFDLWRYLSGGEVANLVTSPHGDATCDEHAVVTATLDGGVIATSFTSTRGVEENALEIYGSTAKLALSFYCFDGVRLVPRGVFSGSLGDRLRGISQSVRMLPGVLDIRYGGTFRRAYREEWLHFIACIERDTPVSCTLAEGRHALQIALAARQSARDGTRVRPADLLPCHL